MPTDTTTDAINPRPMSIEDWEGIAREMHESTGADAPIDAFALAEACGVRVRPWGKARGEWTPSGGIRYPVKARHVRQHGVVAHELGHWALWDAREDHRDCRAARYLAGALMLPRSRFARDLGRCDWDLSALRRLHPNASAEMIVVRMTQVSEACAWVWDDGAVRRRYGVDAVAERAEVEAIVERVIAGGSPAGSGQLRGWPLFERAHRRVVVVRAAA